MGIERPGPLPGLARVWAAPGRSGVVMVMIDETPGLKGTASATLYDLTEFRRLLAELTDVADRTERLLSPPADQPIPDFRAERVER